MLFQSLFPEQSQSLGQCPLAAGGDPWAAHRPSPLGAVIDAGPCPRSHRPAVSALLGQAGPRDCSGQESKLWECARELQNLPARRDPLLQAAWGQPGAALPRSCPGFGRDLGCSRHSHSLRSLPEALPVWLSFPFPSLPALGFTYGIFYLLMFVPHSVGKGRQSPEGTGCRESSCSILTLPRPRWE